LNVAVAPHHDVVGFDIAMDDSRMMRCRQSAGGLNRDIENVDQIDSGGNAPAQSVPVDEFGGDEVVVVADTDFMDGENVWMIKCRDGPRLLNEPLQSLL